MWQKRFLGSMLKRVAVGSETRSVSSQITYEGVAKILEDVGKKSRMLEKDSRALEKKLEDFETKKQGHGDGRRSGHPLTR